MSRHYGEDEDWETAAELHLPWPGSLAFLRIGPDAPHLGAHLAGYGHVGDPDVICSCPRCIADRAKAAASRKPCGCPDYVLCLCRPRKLNHEPGWGKPARTGKAARADDCTCRAEGRPYWPMHGMDCPARSRLFREQRDAGLAEKGAAQDRPPALTPEQEIMAATWEPLGLAEDRLPQYRPFGQGRCGQCGGDPVKPGTTLCWYCDALARLEPGPVQAVREPRHRHKLAGCDGNREPIWRGIQRPVRAGARVGAGVLGFALVVIASHVPSLGMLVVPGIAMLVLGLAGRRRS